jgi:uncharacterized protein YjbJ (UPF0337 family)
MQSSRDSSVWRSLAVAFGDGVAFGVGMKLTRPSGRTSVAAGEPDLVPLAQRLEQMEQRIREIETTPRTLAAPEKAGVPGQALDKQVLEAVVNALDARLRENTSQMERQLTELQAKITIELKTLHQQDRSIADGLQAMIEEGRTLAGEQTARAIREIEEQFHARLEEIRVAAEADRQSMREYLATLRQDLAGQFAVQASGLRKELLGEIDDATGKMASLRQDVAGDFGEQLAGLREELRGELQDVTWQMTTRNQESAGQFGQQLAGLREEIRGEMQDAAGKVAAMAASAADSAIEDRMTPLRSALHARDNEIAELRTKLAGADQAMLDLLHGVGEICHRAAERIEGSAAPAPQGPPPPPPAAEAAEPEVKSDDSVPGFAESNPPGKLWRVPLVSSLVFTSGIMVILHYL